MGEGYEPGADWIEWGSGSSGWLYKYKLNGLESIIYGFEPNTKLNLKYFNFLNYNYDLDLKFIFFPLDKLIDKLDDSSF